jgi:uncharacterized protein
VTFTFLHFAFLAGAGLVAGVIGSAGGITSLISYPALLAVGIAPLSANVTNSIALVGSGLGATLQSGLELRDHRGTLRKWALPAIIGAILGAVLLLVTPSEVFAWIVPFLVASAAVLLLAQPRISRWHGARVSPTSDAPILAAILAVSIYDGYFGAGSGVLMLAVVLILLDQDLVRANALKNALLVIADVLPAVIFAVAGPVVWAAVLPLGIGAIIGGLIGPVVARNAPIAILRIVIACCGFVLAGWLLIQQLR